MNQIPRVQLDFMNKVHEEELQLADSLNHFVKESIALGESHKQIDEIFQKWISHTVIHFDRENKLMKEYHFPAFSIHFEEHEQALNKLNNVQKQWNENRNLQELLFFINQVWRPWFYQHISTMDTMTAMFLNDFNISIEL